MDDVTITRAIVESYTRDFLESADVDVAIAGAGPAGMAAAYYLAREGLNTVIFEKQLRFGGGMPGGGMMFNRIVFDMQGKEILDEFDIRSTEYEEGYYVSDSLETVSTLCSKTIKAGAKIFNLISVEDVMIREEDRINGLVLNWTSVGMAGLHVDPLTIRSKMTIDATGHDSDICRIVEKKVGPRLRTDTGRVIGEKSMWAEVGERDILENTNEAFPGLIVSGMAANAVYGSPRMGAIFSGMLLSGKKAAGLAIDIIKRDE